jgi:hypothetical protein
VLSEVKFVRQWCVNVKREGTGRQGFSMDSCSGVLQRQFKELKYANLTHLNGQVFKLHISSESAFAVHVHRLVAGTIALYRRKVRNGVGSAATRLGCWLWRRSVAERVGKTPHEPGRRKRWLVAEIAPEWADDLRLSTVNAYE